jgi:spermidine synthase
MKLNTQSRPFLYTLSFIEGSAVMSAELLGAKMLAPFYGSSLYVWATVMAVTLGGLAAGYFTGGYFAGKEKNKKNNFLFYIVIVAAIFTAIMPISLKMVIFLCATFSLLPAIIISTIIFLLPPVFLMGMVSPLMIEILSDKQHHAGKVAGSIYAISTLGGIIATFLMGFYIIPTFGLSLPSLITGIFLAILPLIALIKNKSLMLLVISVFCGIGIVTFNRKHAYSDIHILYQKEGVLGQIMVVDYPIYLSNHTKESFIRMMLFNRVIQTYYNKSDTLNTYFPYVSVLINECTYHKKSGKALLLGLGGGCVANELIKKNFEVDAVELDKRVGFAAAKFFNLNTKTKVYIDDARRFIKNTNKKYDLIIFDVFKGEENPAHLITLESLNEVKKLLNHSGMMVVNSYGYRTGKKSRGTKAIIKTIQKAGLYTQVIPSAIKEEEGNLLIFAKQEKFSAQAKKFEFDSLELAAAHVLIDDKPLLEVLNLEAAMAWRSAYIETAIKDFNQRNVPLFN